MTIPTDKRIAVLIPCYNEGLSIAKVVADFSVNLPNAEIYVFDNNSSDNTIAEAKKAGARVIKEKRQGKGFVVASMLSKIDADYYVMVDGDDTYPAASA
jgi:glycosyltransferase involved in cell wall biosynthesis